MVGELRPLLAPKASIGHYCCERGDGTTRDVHARLAAIPLGTPDFRDRFSIAHRSGDRCLTPGQK
jgi:hypothetical protein